MAVVRVLCTLLWGVLLLRGKAIFTLLPPGVGHEYFQPFSVTPADNRRFPEHIFVIVG